jgi:hypothetical protein
MMYRYLTVLYYAATKFGFSIKIKKVKPAYTLFAAFDQTEAKIYAAIICREAMAHCRIFLNLCTKWKSRTIMPASRKLAGMILFDFKN